MCSAALYHFFLLSKLNFGRAGVGQLTDVTLPPLPIAPLLLRHPSPFPHSLFSVRAQANQRFSRASVYCLRDTVRESTKHKEEGTRFRENESTPGERSIALRVLSVVPRHWFAFIIAHSACVLLLRQRR